MAERGYALLWRGQLLGERRQWSSCLVVSSTQTSWPWGEEEGSEERREERRREKQNVEEKKRGRREEEKRMGIG